MRRLWILGGLFGILWIGLLIGGGFQPSSVIPSLFQSAFGSPQAWAGTLKEATPLLGCGVAVYLALKAGLFNIGVEGQFMVGSVAGVWAGLSVPPGPLSIFAAVVCGTLAGALWAFPAAWIRAFRGGHEVITTIMLNEVARAFTTFLLSGPLKSPTQQSPTSAILPSALPELQHRPLFSSATLVAVAMVASLAFWLKRTVAGYELRVVGENARAADVAGIQTAKVRLSSLIVSGGIAGLAGCLQVLGFEHRTYDGFSAGYGFDSLGVALLAGGQPLAMIVAALVFGGLKQGFSALAALYSVPRGLSTLLIGLGILLFAAYRSRRLPVRET